MKKPALKTRLDKYKEDNACQYDGEALLNAAGEGQIHPSHINQISSQEVLWFLGVGMRMTRNDITRCLCTCDRFHGQFDDTAMFLADKPHELRVVRELITSLLGSAICYSEQFYYTELPYNKQLHAKRAEIFQ